MGTCTACSASAHLHCLYCTACTAGRRPPVVMKLDVEGEEYTWDSVLPVLHCLYCRAQAVSCDEAGC
jgi:hypothetical protein